MPLTDTEWDMVTGWVRDFLLDTPDPYTPIKQLGFAPEFIGALPLTTRAGENAVALVRAARRTISAQLLLLDGLVHNDALSSLEAGTTAEQLRAALLQDQAEHASPQDHFLSSVLKNGTEVFIDRAELRGKLREFVSDPEKTVLVVDGEPDSGRSYTYHLIRHLGQHCGFRPVRVTLSRTSTAAAVVRRLTEFVADPRTPITPLNPTQLNDPLPTLDDAVHSVVRLATAADEQFWLVLDDCDRLDVTSDVWDCIGKLALAIYEHAPVRRETVPRLVLLGYSPTTRQLPYEIRKNECLDTARTLGADDLAEFFGQFFAAQPPPGESAGPPPDRVAALVDTALSAVLGAAEADGDESYMRRVCTAVEGTVRVYRSLTEGEDFAARLQAELRPAEGGGGPPPMPDIRRRYREAACLLSRFDPARLRLPGEERATGRAAMELVHDCRALGSAHPAGRAPEPGAGESAPPGTAGPEADLAALTTSWALKSGIREATLRGLAGPEAALAALAANADQFPEGPGPERTALAHLSGAPPRPDEPPRLEGQGVDALADTLQAVLWLEQIPGVTGLPDAEHVQRLLERARLLQPLQRLVQGPFQGRAEELDQLRAYVGLPADSPQARIRQAGHGLRRVMTRAPEPPLVVHGLGGIGKSTLIAKFLLDSLRDFPAGFPFVYADFERPTLAIQEPATLIAEIARQLAVQYPAHGAELDALAHECEATAGHQRQEKDQVDELYELSTTRPTLGRISSSGFHDRASARDTELVRKVADVVVRAAGTPAGQPGPPLVIAVDSFEKAQYRGSPVLGRMWAIWAALQQAYPRLRFIVSGRAPVDHPARITTPRAIALGDLDHKAAVALLTADGVGDPHIADELAERVGGHPLSLKLAARAAVLAGGAADTLGELVEGLPARRRYFYRKVDQMLVQGALYERILQHIPDPEVRELAQAGLALRVITPELITEVLAEPCGLRIDSAERARRLFGVLSRLDLVEPAGPDAVRHRSDLRAIMLRLADNARTDVMRAVGRRAVVYYAAREGPEARAEEIYHRLRLNENPRSVERRWTTGIERYLEGADQDMSPRSAAFLTGLIGGHLPEQVMAEADQEDWERIAAREVEDLLAQGYTEAAAARLAERRPWTPGSPLHPLLVETLARQGHTTLALETAEAAVDRADKAGCAELQLELLLLSARLAEAAGDASAADRDLAEAVDIATLLGRDFEAMGALLARARLAERTPGDPDRAEVDDRLARRLRLLPDSALAEQPVLVRAVAAEVCDQDPAALDRTLEVVGLPQADDGVVEALAESIGRAAAEQPQLRAALLRILQGAVGEPERPPGEPATGSTHTSMTGILREARRRGTLDGLARRLLVVRDRSGELLSGVAAALGAGTSGAVPKVAPPPSPAAAAPERNGPKAA
ncbi:AAA family ATPase [Streptomyces purpureus]|uniref:Orc1-like AAA ATPase domain-containing protein n=1 Tax=Streptomyces purpureus TaxID=1951 RepID=A0A918GW63_9ACTN|nr:AAA family ATPase [Streptomyces purpureus]GGT12328.1 hypothetical protein GCM10014713_00930 [Streptomyces purpureus]